MRNRAPRPFRPHGPPTTSRQRFAAFDAAVGRKPAHLAGYDWQWHKVRRAFIADHSLCRCGRPAEVVDHITPLHLDPSCRLDPGNLQSLCRGCHATKTAADRAGGRTRRD